MRLNVFNVPGGGGGGGRSGGGGGGGGYALALNCVQENVTAGCSHTKHTPTGLLQKAIG